MSYWENSKFKGKRAALWLSFSVITPSYCIGIFVFLILTLIFSSYVNQYTPHAYLALSKLAATCGVGTAPRVLHQQQHEQAPHRWHIVWQRQHRRMAMANPFSGCPKIKTIPCLTRARAESGRWNLIRIFLAKKPKKTLTWSACFLDPRLRPRIANFHILIVAAKLAPQVASCVKRNWWQQCHLLLELPAAS